MRLPGMMSFLLAGTLVGLVAAGPYVSGWLASAGPEDTPLAGSGMRSAEEAEPTPEPQADQEPEGPQAPDEPDSGQEPPEPPADVAAAPQPDPPANLPHLDPAPEVRIAAALPAVEAKLYSDLVVRGQALRQQGESSPAYHAAMTAALADSLIHRGIFRAAVLDGMSRLFVFTSGGLSSAAGPRIAVGDDTRGFSGRVIVLDGQGRNLVEKVARAFGTRRGSLRPCLLVRSELDLMVLAMQKRAAVRCKADLKRVVCTFGRFCLARGMPFIYEVSEIQTTDGRRTRVPGSIRAGGRK